MSSNERRCLRSTYAASLSTASPRSCPCSSLTCLKWSRSPAIRQTGAPVSAACCASSSKRLPSALRLSSPVSGSSTASERCSHLGAHQRLARTRRGRRSGESDEGVGRDRRAKPAGRRRRSRRAGARRGHAEAGLHAARREARGQRDDRQQQHRDRRAVRPAAQRDADARSASARSRRSPRPRTRAGRWWRSAGAAGSRQDHRSGQRDQRPRADPRDADQERDRERSVHDRSCALDPVLHLEQPLAM